MAYYSDAYTEKELKKLGAYIDSVYAQAYSELEKKYSNYINGWNEIVDGEVVHHKGLKERYAEELRAYHDEKYEPQEFLDWFQTQEGRGEYYKTLMKDMSSHMTAVNMNTAKQINGASVDIFRENYNFEAYSIENAYSGIQIMDGYGNNMSVAFDICDNDTVERLMTGKQKLVPKCKVKIPKDKQWNKEKLQNCLIQGILQGESVPDIAKRFQQVTNMNKHSALRNARTSANGAENAGRLQCYTDAKGMGIDLEMEWISTSDKRTRDSHAQLDGVRVPNGEKFPNGCRFPGDPEAKPEEVWNCRCTTRAILPKINDTARTGNTVATYKEWLKQKRKEKRKKKPIIVKQNPVAPSVPPVDTVRKSMVDNIMNSRSINGFTDAQKKEYRQILENMTDEQLELYKTMVSFHDGNQYIGGPGWYMPFYHKVEMDINDTCWERSMGRNESGAWKVKFHEELHQLDHIYGITVDNSPFSKATTIEADFGKPGVFGKRINDAMSNDLLAFVNDAVFWYNKNNGTSIKQLKGFDRISKDSVTATRLYLNNFCKDLSKDMGYTDSKTRAILSAFTDSMQLYTGDRISFYGYWGHDGAYNKDRKKNGAASEAFAEIGAHIMRNDSETLEVLEMIMPNTVEEYRGIIHDIAVYAKTNKLTYLVR